MVQSLTRALDNARATRWFLWKGQSRLAGPLKELCRVVPPLRLLRRLQSGRVRPRLDVRGGLGLADLLEQLVTFRTVRHILSLRARIRDEFGKPIVKGYCLIETTPHLHGALFSARGRRERNWRSHHR